LSAITQKLTAHLIFLEFWSHFSAIVIEPKSEDVREVIQEIGCENFQEFLEVVWMCNTEKQHKVHHLENFNESDTG
jgi:hypothetical protein